MHGGRLAPPARSPPMKGGVQGLGILPTDPADGPAPLKEDNRPPRVVVKNREQQAVATICGATRFEANLLLGDPARPAAGVVSGSGLFTDTATGSRIAGG